MKVFDIRVTKPFVASFRGLATLHRPNSVSQSSLSWKVEMEMRYKCQIWQFYFESFTCYYVEAVIICVTVHCVKVSSKLTESLLGENYYQDVWISFALCTRYYLILFAAGWSFSQILRRRKMFDKLILFSVYRWHYIILENKIGCF